MAEQTILDGKYRLVRPAGTGGTARVFLAEDTKTGERVAVKVLRRELLDDSDMRARFQREASLLWQIDHPGIVKLLKFEERAKEGLLLVLEWIDGVRLDELIAREQLSGAVRVELLAQLASALGAIHQNGIAHRDVKPDNAMVTGWPDAPRVKLLDFGIARFTDPKEAALMFQTNINKVGGTPSYVSPEQAMGRAVTAASDVYSLGIVGYLLLSGSLPFKGGHFDVLSAHLNDPPPPLVPIDDALAGHPALQVVVQCLEKNPAKRPADGAAVEALLRAPKKKGLWPFTRP
ncbi:MAG: serine/threonine-protein kinase [Myxococcales bacterium]|nr:serine/threonine-protein kinase [Myxococcales bacterium]